ncbi:MAG: Rrf2 family transcriptional regulator [Opitutaceae bacterium]|jgi:Rrf2 family protein
MKLSKKGEYALRALIDLGIADLVGRNLVRVSEIAGKEKMSVKFLEQVMLQLREAGYVGSERGKFGGYRLAKPAAKICLGEIIRLIDGPLAPIGCVSQTSYVPCSCPDEAHCGLRMVMLDVRNAIAGILDRYTLADVVDVTTRKMRRNGVSLPFSEPPPGGTRRQSATRRSDGLMEELLGEYSI